MASRCGPITSPGPDPSLRPHALMNVPSFASFTMRSPSGGAGPRGMTVGDEDLAARVDDDIVRSDEGVGPGDADAGLAERHQQLAVTIELEDLKALARGLARFVERPAVGDPDVAFGIDVQTMRLQEHPLAEALHELSRGVEHQHRHLAAAVVAGADDAVPPGVGGRCSTHRLPWASRSASANSPQAKPGGTCAQFSTRRKGLLLRPRHRERAGERHDGECDDGDWSTWVRIAPPFC